MPPVLVDREPWVLFVVVALTAVCGGVAVRAQGTRDRGERSARAERFGRAVGRIGWPVAPVLVGTGAYAAVQALLVDLHSGGGSGTVVTVAGLAPSGLLGSMLLLTGLLLTGLLLTGSLFTALPPLTPPWSRHRWVLPTIAVVTAELLIGVNPFQTPHGRPLGDHLVGGVVGLVLALGAWAGLRRLAEAEAVRAVPWSLLLPGVVATTGDVLGLDLWVPAQPGTGVLLSVAGLVVGVVALVGAGVVVVRRPRTAADAAALGLVGIGAYGTVQGAFGRTLVVVGTFGEPRGPAPVVPDGFGHNAAVLGGIQGALLLALGLWLLPRTVLPDARRLWGREPDPALTERVRELTTTRAEAVSSAAAELRRIERDLHDGAQGRLVAIGINLRAAEDMVASSPQEATALIAEARQASAAALEELRGLVRGICPPVLADRGLGEAIRALAMDLPLPCATEIDLPGGRLDAPVESAVYFAVAEVVTNAVRHADARAVRIRTAVTDGMLRVEVTDDGVGGADPAAGSGLAGVERRLAAFDGILAVSSPPGGPTIVVMEVPCP
ncbi:sensor histidine kinase [Streptacidiphilus anmyonensis]|uniref:sensor histidine kinase n=1 Tax=Streptacidiphilus anmyonensis TaxID=405782 RepID=UPI001EEF4B6B|nr:histidine kinase [Streptacidiphilus anmyonensis]